MANFRKFILLRKDKQGVKSGALKVFLRKHYGTEEIAVNRTVNVNGDERTVTEIVGSYKVDGFMARQIKYLFDVELPEDSFLQVRVGLWDKIGDAINKFNLKEEDLFMFVVSKANLTPFDRKDGTTGYSLDATAFDFEPLYSKGGDGDTKPATATKPADIKPATKKTAKPVAKSAPERDDLDEDFADLLDDGDLPF